MTRALLLTAGLLALAAPAAAQTGYGQPSPGQYRAEQRTTARLNAQNRDDAEYVVADEDWSPAPARPPRLGYDGYGPDDESAAARPRGGDRAPPPAYAEAHEGYGDDADDRAAYDRDLAEHRRARADYRRRSAQHRADLARWRERVDACNGGVRDACAGYETRYGSYADGRYAPPAPASDQRYDNRRGYAPRTDDRFDGRSYDAADDWDAEERYRR